MLCRCQSANTAHRTSHTLNCQVNFLASGSSRCVMVCLDVVNLTAAGNYELTNVFLTYSVQPMTAVHALGATAIATNESNKAGYK